MVVFICRIAEFVGALFLLQKPLSGWLCFESTASPGVACDRQNRLKTRVFIPAYLLQTQVRNWSSPFRASKPQIRTSVRLLMWGSLHSFSHIPLRHHEVRGMYQAAQPGPGMCLDCCLAQDELTLRGSARAVQECRSMD